MSEGNSPTQRSPGSGLIVLDDGWLGLPPESSLPPPEGALIDGTYRVIRGLGAGAMGTVVLARDEKLERDVAIKLVRPNLVSGPDFRAQFVAEARAMARVRHPNVVTVYAFGEWQSRPYFVMDYVPGFTVEGWLAQRRTVSVDEALGVIDQVCQGVEAIHRSGAVHGDLKSSNVLVGPDFQVKVADLGLARVVGRQSLEGAPTIGGTPEYMAPEMLVTTEVDPAFAYRQDVYALGVLAFELLTGRFPFTAPTPEGVVRHHLLTPPPPPSELRPELPPALDWAILDALEKDPARRTRSAEDLRKALLTARAQAAAQRRVVVVDDDDDFRKLLVVAMKLAHPNAEVVGAANGAEGLALVDAAPTSLVIIDLQMPEMNGLELLAALRGNEKTAAVPVIAVSGVGSGAEARAMAELGVQGFLLKPAAPQAILALARTVLE